MSKSGGLEEKENKDRGRLMNRGSTLGNDLSECKTKPAWKAFLIMLRKGCLYKQHGEWITGNDSL